MVRFSLARATCVLSALVLAALQPLAVKATISITSFPAALLPGHVAPPPAPPASPYSDDSDDSFDVFGDSDDDELDPRSRQAWERVWTVATHSASLSDAQDKIDEVVVSLPGRVFLSAAPASSPGGPLATVRFSGNSDHVLDAFEVVSTAAGTIEIRQRAGLTAKSTRGYLLVEVTLTHAQSLKRLTAKTSADVVVEPNVLVATASSDVVSVVVEGSGSVFVHDTPALFVQQLALTVKGSGDIELSTTQVETKQVVATIGGSGAIRLFANALETKDAAFAVGGSGSVFVNSYKLHADEVTVAIAGSGDVSVYPIGACTKENIVIAGSGDAYVGSIACEVVDVKIGGSGDAVVQASQAIQGGVIGAGEVKYVGVAPQTIAPRATFFQSKKEPKPIAKAASHNKFHEARMRDAPERVPVRLAVETVVFSDRAALVPLVLVALVAAWFIRRETKKQQQQDERLRGELQPLNAPGGQSQVFV